MNKSNTDKYVISPIAAGLLAGGASTLLIPNVGTVKMLGVNLPPMAAIGVAVAIGTALANIAEKPIKDAIPDYGESVNNLVLPAMSGVFTVGTVAGLIDGVTMQGVVGLFTLGAVGNTFGDILGDMYKTSMS
jgi:hypothetical protein